MSRTSLPFAVADLSALTRSLRSQLSQLGHTPGHLELLNMLARAAGFGNYQHFRAQMEAQSRLARSRNSTPKAETERIEKTVRQFDAAGRLLRWPGKSAIAELCLWVLWSRIPKGEVFDERQISALLDGWHVFGDHALLRRALYDFKLVDRTVDGREYRRLEAEAPKELTAVNARLLGERR